MSKLRDIFIDRQDGELKDAFYVILFFALTHVFFWKFLVPGNMIFGTDIQNQSFPIQHMAVGEMIKHRSIMLWNPYIFGGMPFLASFSFPFFYPLAVMFFVLPLGFAMGYEIVLHFFMMGVFMFAFLRHLKLSRQAAFIGGLLFMFNAHLVSLVYPGHGGKLFTMTYLPLALMFLDRALKADKPLKDVMLMGLMVALMFFSGHIQILFYCGITLTLYLLAGVALDIRKRGVAWALKRIGGFGLAFALGTMLYAVMLFPAWEYRGYTHRAGGVVAASSYEFATSFSVGPEDLLYLVMRDPFGWGKDYGPTIPTTSGIFYRGRQGLRLSVDYAGIFGLVLALIGVLFVRNRYTWFFAGLALLSMFLALGQFNPFYVYVYKYIPGFSMFRVPYAIIILMPMCVGVMAAFGIERLLNDRKAGQGRGLMYFILAGTGVLIAALAVGIFWSRDPSGVTSWLLGFGWVRMMLWEFYGDIGMRFGYFLKNVFIFTIFLALSMLTLFVYWKGWLKAKYLTLAAAALILVDLWPVGWDFVKTVPTTAIGTTFFRETPQIRAMKDDTDGPFRAFSMVTNNELLYEGIQCLTGYHAVPLGYYERTLNSVNFGNQVLDMLNARYIMLPKEPEYDFRAYPDPALRDRLMRRYELISEEDYFFYKSRTALPRAFLVSDVWRVDDIEQALPMVADERFMPARSAIVAEDVAAERPVDPRSDLSGQKVSVSYYSPDRIAFDVLAPADSFMVVSEVWYPGWKAYVDGAEARVYRTDYLLRGLVVPAGGHKVEMKFEPAPFKLGGAVSIATLLLYAGVFGWPAYRRRGAPGIQAEGRGQETPARARKKK